VVVFSWTTCPFCVKAKGLLTEVGAKYTAVELNTMDNGPAIRAELAKVGEGENDKAPLSACGRCLAVSALDFTRA
jgi:glutaredoxin